MPFISSKVNVEVSKEKEIILKEKLGKAIETIPGKSEAYLMLEIQDNCKLYFRGDNSTGIAYVEVKILGAENPAAFDKMTGVICNIFEEVLNIAPDNVYVKYEAVSNWGYNGHNF